MAKIKEKLREFGLTTLAVSNGTSVFLITIMILFFGFLSYQSMPKEQFPEAVFPTIFINTPYPGNSAQDIENLVTRPIEKELQSIAGLKAVKSTSLQDFSAISAEFDTDFDTEEVLRKVKDAVDRSKSELPNDLPTDPVVVDVNLSDIPIMTVNISGNYTLDQLKEYADYLEDEIEEVDEVNDVDQKGALEREVKIDVDLLKMESMEVSFADIENAVRSENMNMSGGEILKDDFRRAIRVVGEFETMEQLEQMIVKAENQNPIYLKDIATVNFGYKDRTSIARSTGYPVISLDVIKRKGENLLDAADKIKVVVKKAQTDVFPEGIRVSIFNDQSIATRDQVSNLENSIISGVLLVVLVLLFFLGLRNASFVGLAIPLSMLMGIMILNLTGVTMNIVVLFGLILALGLLVDNAIVVVENIYRYMQNGKSGEFAAKYGAGEVALPIIASTATTLAAFLPLAFWPGIVGVFMQYLPITLIIVLSSSLFVALVINPVFTSKLMKVDERSDEKSVRRKKLRNIMITTLIMVGIGLVAHVGGAIWLRNTLIWVIGITLLNFFILRPASFAFQNSFLPILERGYDRFIRGALYKKVPGMVFIGTFCLLFFALWLLNVAPPKVEFFPSADPLYANAFVELPIGSDIEATNKVVKVLETQINAALEDYQPIIEEVLVQIGENTSDPNAPPEPGTTPNKARLTVSFVPDKERGELSSLDAMNKMREYVKGIPGAQIAIAQNPSGPSAGKPINLEISGENMDELAILSEQVITYLNSKNIPGVEELQADVKIGKPELIIKINRDAARRYGVSTFSIADAIRTSVYGKEISKYKLGEEEYKIFVRLDPKYRNNINNLLNQKITFRNPANGRISQVPISTVASAEYSSTYSSIKRKDLDRAITISSNVEGDYNANEIIAEMDSYMQDYELPNGFNYEFTGEQQQQAEDMAFLTTAFGVAVFAIFIILVAQFNSISSPFIIILSVLFSTIGVFLGYIITGRDISVVFTGVGIISLAGVVVNNAIVLIDYINLLLKNKREELGVKKNTQIPIKMAKEAIIEAGSTRLRPVLLTAITTVLGLVPLAIGLNINFFTLVSEFDPQYFLGGDNTALWGPMAWTVIYGLVFATFLTLVVVPVMFWLTLLFKRWIRKISGSAKADQDISPDMELAE